MKAVRITPILLALFLLIGCSHDYARMQQASYNQKLEVYRQAVAARSAQPPMLQITFHEDGKIASLSVSHEVEYPEITDFRPAPDPNVAMANTAIRAAATLGGIWLVGDALSTVLDSAGNTTTTTTNSNSYHGQFDRSFNSGNTNSMIGSKGISVPNNSGEVFYNKGGDYPVWKPEADIIIDNDDFPPVVPPDEVFID